MRSGLTFTLKEVIYLILAITVIVTLLIITSLIAINYSKSGNQILGDIISFLGNLVGGLLGGVVAYIVAAYQVNKTKENEDNKSVSSSYALLRLIKAELINNKKIIIAFKEDFSLGKLSLISNISTLNWIRCSDRLGIEVKEETVNKLQTCYTKIEAIKSTNESIQMELSENLVTEMSDAIALLDKNIKELIQ